MLDGLLINRQERLTIKERQHTFKMQVYGVITVTNIDSTGGYYEDERIGNAWA